MKTKHLIVTFISFLTFLLISNQVMSAASAAGEAAAAIAVKNSLVPSIVSQNNEVLVSLVTNNAEAIASEISADDLRVCAGGAGCQAVFNAIMRNLNKLLTPEFRMTNAIHLFRPDKVQFSKSLTQKLSKVLLAAK